MMLDIIQRTDGVQDAETCRACGGECCKRAAGITHPEELGPRERLTEAIVGYLRTGFWAVDCWEGDVVDGGGLGQIWYLRPAHTNAVGEIIDRSHGGECRLWCHGHGCSLRFENRPHGCRNLIPKSEGNNRCILPESMGGVAGKEFHVRAWRDYQEEIDAAIDIMLAERGADA